MFVSIQFKLEFESRQERGKVLALMRLQSATIKSLKVSQGPWQVLRECGWLRGSALLPLLREIFTRNLSLLKAIFVEGKGRRLAGSLVPSRFGGNFQWFYSKFTKRLEEKPRISGLKVLKVNPAYTSRICAKCGKEGRLEGLTFKCSCGTYDRDYNASLNIAKRALRQAKLEVYKAEGIPSRFPSRLVRMEGSVLLTMISLFRLLSCLKVVHTSYLKHQKLLKWINSDKYG